MGPANRRGGLVTRSPISICGGEVGVRTGRAGGLGCAGLRRGRITSGRVSGRCSSRRSGDGSGGDEAAAAAAGGGAGAGTRAAAGGGQQQQ